MFLQHEDIEKLFTNMFKMFNWYELPAVTDLRCFSLHKLCST